MDQENLYTGPEVDGRPTWFAEMKDVPEDWEARSGTDSPWHQINGGLALAEWVQCRPVVVPVNIPPVSRAAVEEVLSLLAEHAESSSAVDDMCRALRGALGSPED